MDDSDRKALLFANLQINNKSEVLKIIDARKLETGWRQVRYACNIFKDPKMLFLLYQVVTHGK